MDHHLYLTLQLCDGALKRRTVCKSRFEAARYLTTVYLTLQTIAVLCGARVSCVGCVTSETSELASEGNCTSLSLLALQRLPLRPLSGSSQLFIEKPHGLL